MSDQNQFDQIKQKLLQLWGVFLAACGKLWQNVRKYSKQAWAFLCRTARALGRKLAAFAVIVKRKSGELFRRFSQWLAGVKERIAAAVPRKSEAQPAAETAVVPAEPEQVAVAEPAETAVESVEEPVETVSRRNVVFGRELPPWLQKTAAVLVVVGNGVRFVLRWLWKLRSVIMAVPVVWMAIKFARENMDRLPESVGLDLQSTGEFAQMITREQAVYWPLGITAFCLVLMFCSKKPLLPWVISIFSLVLPWLIWLTNYYA